MEQKKVVLVIAYEGYQHIEYNETKKIVESAGIQIITASNKIGFALALNGSTTQVNTLIDTLQVQLYDGIFFIGGPTTLHYLDNNASYRVLQKALQYNVAFGGICIATRILAYADVLSNKRATGWDEDNKLGSIYKDHDVLYVKEPVVIDDRCVTATGPQAAQNFGYAIIKVVLH